MRWLSVVSCCAGGVILGLGRMRGFQWKVIDGGGGSSLQ
ncbi:hypothetical protein ABID39_001577 [Bartonella japonica]|uniref:Uncharacterized protein n=1 Tax=Bartonella japonica TaxID=357761 RepID=A0ABV2FQL5_9HYPH